MEYYSAIKKQSSYTCPNMDEPQKHYARSKKPGTKYHLLHDVIYIKCLSKTNLWRQKVD